MKFVEHKKTQNEESTENTTENITIKDINYTAFNGLIPIQVQKVTTIQASDEIYDIAIKLKNIAIGNLCITSQAGKMEIAALTDAQTAAYRYELNGSPAPGDGTYKFVHDYVVIKKDHINDYIDNMHSSPIWGGYVHIDDFELHNTSAQSSTSTIEISPGLNYRTKRHSHVAAKSAISPLPADRYLSLYQCLELDYDYLILKRIKELSDDNPTSIWQQIRGFDQNDINRLTELVGTVDNIDQTYPIIVKIRNHEKASKTIFYDYGKDSNPIKEWGDFKSYFIESADISFDDFNKIAKEKKPTLSFGKTENEFIERMKKCISYWIYRVRCSIAHNKLGEYHLTTSEDLALLTDVMLPLIIKLVSNRFSQ